MGNCCGCRSRPRSIIIDDKEESGRQTPPNPQTVPLGLTDAVLIDIIYYDEAPPPPPTTVGAIEPTSSLTASNTLADFYASAANAIQTVSLGFAYLHNITYTRKGIIVLFL